ncbi:hypothetical protein FHR24_001185 [Wenyingzhuangia heitensis]|uniref:Long-chain fatty acid transport protein n=1 Tax=Wenyingzhuangia heitensis TaxID=1487859 RepID=A0ABX0UC69_9FLAO|nr:hypothetical protein [Wenyingzhuangia heitensis]NIJ44746.1 hypothetical protein [Wenyingzhuangia heitensis]
MFRLIIVLYLFGTTFVLQAQNINSPYSLFGLGSENSIASGGLTGMGNTGIAESVFNEINLFNPASLGAMVPETFLQELGVSGLYSTLKNNTISESATKGNVSHIAFAFPIKKGWGLSLGLLPYTSTGYKIDLENNVIGSTDTYITRITGSGGLNKAYISTGFSIGSKLHLGVDFSALFGSIKEDSQVSVGYLVNVNDTKRYNGVVLKTGFQYTMFQNENNKTVLGGVVELPTTLSGTQTRNSFRTSSAGIVTVIEEEEETDSDNVELPLSIGFGLNSTFKQIKANLDFKKTFWNNTSQDLNDELYVNQTIYALGMEFRSAKAYSRIRYRVGVNYNSGFLQISNTQINSYFGSVGVGFPINKQGGDRVNISYSYGKEGSINDGLIQENFHKLSLNFSFNGSWFKKTKIN